MQKFPCLSLRRRNPQSYHGKSSERGRSTITAISINWHNASEIGGGQVPINDNRFALKFLSWNIIIICRYSSRSLGTLDWEPYLCPPHFFMERATAKCNVKTNRTLLPLESVWLLMRMEYESFSQERVTAREVTTVCLLWSTCCSLSAELEQSLGEPRTKYS